MTSSAPTAVQRAGPWSRLHAMAALALCATLLMPACSQQSPRGGALVASAGSPRFPVAVAFPLDRANATATVEFELPDTRENGGLRPVFIGFQSFGKGRNLTDAELKKSRAQMQHMRTDPIPFRIRLDRIDSSGEQGVALHEMQPGRNAQGYPFYLPVQGNVATKHHPTGEDSDELLQAGLYDVENYYLTHEIARIVPPAPGRYRLSVESLEDQPALRGLSFRLIVSHYHVRGIQ